MSELRELDALVARQVMGWQQRPNYNYWMTFSPGGTFELHALIATWKPSTEIDDSLRFVRPRMRELGFTFRLSDAPNGRSAVSFFHDDAEQGLAGAAVEDTDALAICRAALEAVKEKAKAASG